MTRFAEAEKRRQAEFKKMSPTFSDSARVDGPFKSKQSVKLYPHCLPVDFAEENLYPAIRSPAVSYFQRYGIQSYRQSGGKPNNNMVSSQIFCLNFLFPFANEPDALAALLRPVFPEIQHMVVGKSGRFVEFEWIGEKNYLHEGKEGAKRIRGPNTTSADAKVTFDRSDGVRQTVLMEWKYTESYGGDEEAEANGTSRSTKVSKTRTDRSQIYSAFYERDDCPLDKTLLPSFDALFYQPFDQLMRLQFLAHEMERAREAKAKVVSVLSIAPAHNRDFQTVTSPVLSALGDTVSEVWKRLVKPSDRFDNITTEALFRQFPIDGFRPMDAWRRYMTQRYGWLDGKTQA